MRFLDSLTFDIKNNSPLYKRYINHYTKGIKHIYRAELYEKDDALSENKRMNKLNRQYKRALYHFTEAGKFQAEESTIYSSIIGNIMQIKNWET